MAKYYKKILVLGILVFSVFVFFPKPALAQNQCGYSLYNLAREYSGFAGAPWYDVVANSQVIGAADKTDITYSTTQGNWLPANTYIGEGSSLRLNVVGEHNSPGSDPRTGYQVRYRVWGSTEVSVKTKTWGEWHTKDSRGNQGCLMNPVGTRRWTLFLDRVDTIKRVSSTSFLINGAPQTISVGSSYTIASTTWWPEGNGSGYTFLKIENIDSGYFNVYQEVWEYDEECDSAHVRIESYIESVGNVVCPGCQHHNVYGWAWPDNVGWMSFSCENCDSDLNGYVDVSCGGDNATTPSADYGVDIDPVSLLFSGYAWSENIGWISFEPASVSGCDHFVGPGATSCQAFIESTTNDIHGWARACSVFQAGCSGTLKSNGERGGWDGWLKFDGSDVFYGSYVDNTPIPSEFRKWAWGDNVVIGWTSLNNLDTGGAADYKVITDLTLNAVPIASFSCEDCSSNPIASCKVYRGDTLCLVNNSTDPDGNDQIVLSEWHQDDLTDGLGYSLFSSCSPPPSPNLCSTTFGSTRGNWNVKLYVEDLMGGFDEDIKTVTVLRDIVASFECSLDNINWYACTDSGNISLVQGDTLYLRDTSVASEISFGSNAVVNNWTWTVDGSNAGSTSQINIPQVQTTGIVIELTVIDSGGRTDTRQEILLGAMPLPTWKEITPF